MPVTTTTKFARKGISQKKPTEKKSHPHKNKKKITKMHRSQQLI